MTEAIHWETLTRDCMPRDGSVQPEPESSKPEPSEQGVCFNTAISKRTPPALNPKPYAYSVRKMNYKPPWNDRELDYLPLVCILSLAYGYGWLTGVRPPHCFARPNLWNCNANGQREARKSFVYTSGQNATTKFAENETLTRKSHGPGMRKFPRRSRFWRVIRRDSCLERGVEDYITSKTSEYIRIRRMRFVWMVWENLNIRHLLIRRPQQMHIVLTECWMMCRVRGWVPRKPCVVHK